MALGTWRSRDTLRRVAEKGFSLTAKSRVSRQLGAVSFMLPSSLLTAMPTHSQQIEDDATEPAYRAAMSAPGQTRTSAGAAAMSAVSPNNRQQ
jgi:hypothetical protein